MRDLARGVDAKLTLHYVRGNRDIQIYMTANKQICKAATKQGDTNSP
jgi:hypothetical protein